MTTFEIITLCIMLYGVVTGWQNGLVKEVCSSAGFLLGLLLAYYCYTHFGMELVWAVALCIFFPLGLGLVANILSRGLNRVFFVGWANHVLGALLGGAKCAILVYVVAGLIKKCEEWKNLLL